ncbi:MAG: hypothetical protein LBV13_03290 [Methanomassiliicoccaceae archaeon]|jgi:hypothetical protein|nr:hypothetical protein [Methanomassiliicoccaceae archaeon]
MEMTIDTIVAIVAAVLTASLIILNYVILRGSFLQNKLTIEQYEQNLKISEESLKLNRSMLEENRKMIDRQELAIRPKFRIMQDGFRFDAVSGKPHLHMENIGGKAAQAKKIHITIIKNFTGIIKEMEIEKSIKPGAPLNLEIDLPVSIIGYDVKRNDGKPIEDKEIIFLSLNAVIEYTHIGDAGTDADPFTDVLMIKIGKDYFESDEYSCTQKARRSVEKETWYNILGTGTNL